MQVGWTYNAGGSSTGGGDTCPCEVQVISIGNDETYNLDLSNDQLEKVYLIFTGTAWTLNLPSIAAAAYRGVELYFMFLSAGNLTINPNGTDAIAGLGAGVAASYTSSLGSSGYMWIGSSTRWAALAIIPTATTTTILQVTPADFTGNNYTNALLVGKTANTGFLVYSDNGSGTLLSSPGDFTFNSGTGTITLAPPDNLRILIP